MEGYGCLGNINRSKCQLWRETGYTPVLIDGMGQAGSKVMR